MKKILVLNAGSSSLKFQLFFGEEVKASGLVEKIGEKNSRAKITFGSETKELHKEIPDHTKGLKIVQNMLRECKILDDFNELDAVGHRVVHGGDKFVRATLVDEKCKRAIRELIPLAPLHNRANLTGIATVELIAPKVKNVAVFDTAFHQTMPEYAYRYAVSKDFYEHDGVRRYGFHGTSHQFVANEARKILGVEKLNAISAHLGSGASICAIRDNLCVDTSMGLTPLEGLVMGTRCGDIDAGALFYLAERRGYTIYEIDKICNKQSGLLGLCGVNDMREIEAKMSEGDKEAALAYDIFCYRVAKYIGAYLVATPANALIFTAGIGENDAKIRKSICEQIAHLGFEIDDELNQTRGAKIISKSSSPRAILVIPTNEELEIALQVAKILGE